MSAQGVHKITEDFEKALCDYTGAPYAVAVDNCSNALFLALYYELKVSGRFETFDSIEDAVEGRPITIPANTYPAVPCEIIHAGGRVIFNKDHHKVKEGRLSGMYYLNPTNVIDSALRFTYDMYVRETHICLSFTGPYKHLKLGKGGAILTDDYAAYCWFKRARFSGRQECSYHEDVFDATIIHLKEGVGKVEVPPVCGWNFYMLPEIAARGLQLMLQFFMPDGKPKHNEDLCLAYPDLSKFKIYQ